MEYVYKNKKGTKWKRRENVAFYGYSDLAKEVADDLNLYPRDVKRVLSSAALIARTHLIEASADKDVEVQPMEGVFIKAKYLPETIKDDFVTKNHYYAESLEIRSRVSSTFKQKAKEDFAVLTEEQSLSDEKEN